MPTDFEQVLEFEPVVFDDDRGAFFESFNSRAFAKATGLDVDFVQDNHSLSRRGVLRGLHYQLPPHAQGKLVRVVVGAVFDVAVDIRRGSETFAEWIGVELSAQRRNQLWIPPGFAHGFLTLSDTAEVLYKTTDYYAPDFDRSIRWDDDDVGIIWPSTGTEVSVSAKDENAPRLSDADCF